MSDLAVIPNEIVERIAAAMVGKWRGLTFAGHGPEDLQAHIDSAVQTTVADVCLILEGSVPIEAYEMGYEMGRVQ